MKPSSGILTDPNYGIHDPDQCKTWVRFTLRQLQRELACQGKLRSYIEIQHAIDVMSKSIITLYVEGKDIWNGAVLQNSSVPVGRNKYLADSEPHHAARLSAFISESINKLDSIRHLTMLVL